MADDYGWGEDSSLTLNASDLLLWADLPDEEDERDEEAEMTSAERLRRRNDRYT